MEDPDGFEQMISNMRWAFQKTAEDKAKEAKEVKPKKKNKGIKRRQRGIDRGYAKGPGGAIRAESQLQFFSGVLFWDSMLSQGGAEAAQGEAGYPSEAAAGEVDLQDPEGLPGQDPHQGRGCAEGCDPQVPASTGNQQLWEQLRCLRILRQGH